MFCQFLDTIEVQKRKIDDLMAQAAEIESLKMQLSTENEKLENNESQIQVLKTDNQGIASITWFGEGSSPNFYIFDGRPLICRLLIIHNFIFVYRISN